MIRSRLSLRKRDAYSAKRYASSLPCVPGGIANSPYVGVSRVERHAYPTNLPPAVVGEGIQNIECWANKNRVAHDERGLLWNGCCTDISEMGVKRNSLLDGAVVHSREEIGNVFCKRRVACGQRTGINEDVAFVGIGEDQ